MSERAGPRPRLFSSPLSCIGAHAESLRSILTPPTSILPSHKVPADLAALDAWLDANLPQADAAIISSELFLYGGLINSRCSNDSTDAVMARLAQLAGFKQTYPRLRLLVSGVVMRIPAYNGDFEEPWYWANYGYDLFSYSFFLDKFNHTQNQSDLNSALYYESLVPPHAVSEFVWRRHRNFNVSVAMLGLQNASGQALFDHLYITQDDNAQYGFNIEEANALRALVAQDSLQATVAIYPGACARGFLVFSIARSLARPRRRRRGAVDDAVATCCRLVCAHAASAVAFPRPDNRGLHPELRGAAHDRDAAGAAAGRGRRADQLL